jgi:hypothetical protein
MAKFVVIIPINDDEWSDLYSSTVDEIHYWGGADKGAVQEFKNAHIFTNLVDARQESGCWYGAIVIPV